MACQVIPPAIDCAYIDKATIKSIQDALATYCPFLNQIYGISEVGERREKDEKPFKYPRLFVGDADKNKYVDLSPDSDKFGRLNYSFFEIDNNERVRFLREEQLIAFRLNLIVWAKMDTITADVRDITDYLIAKVKNALEQSEFNSFIYTIEAIKDKHKVFSKYDYSFELLRNIAWPYTCFKIEMDVQTIDKTSCIDDSCINPV